MSRMERAALCMVVRLNAARFESQCKAEGCAFASLQRIFTNIHIVLDFTIVSKLADWVEPGQHRSPHL